SALVAFVVFLVSFPTGVNVGRQRPRESVKSPTDSLALVSPCGSLPAGASFYPYPECEEIVTYLRKTATDADSLEIVEWSRRKEVVYETRETKHGLRETIRIKTTSYSGQPTTRESPTDLHRVTIDVTIRSANALGAKEISKLRFNFHDGNLTLA